MLLTAKEIKSKYGCSSGHRCISCEQVQTCNAKPANEYRIYKKKRMAQLRTKYKCTETGKLCSLDKCSKFSSCSRLEKTNFLKWKRAFYDDRKKELEKLSGRNVDGYTIS